MEIGPTLIVQQAMAMPVLIGRGLHGKSAHGGLRTTDETLGRRQRGGGVGRNRELGGEEKGERERKKKGLRYMVIRASARG